MIMPTSLNRGEGLIAGLAGEVGSVQDVGEGEVVVKRWWWRKERMNKINRDVVDHCLELCLPT